MAGAPRKPTVKNSPAWPPDVWPLDLDRDELTVLEDGFFLHEFINPLLIERALDAVRAAVRGNGIDPAEVGFTGFDGGVVPFTAQMNLRAVPEISRKSVAGQQPGDSAGSETAAREKIAVAATAAVAEPQTLTHVTAQLQRRRNAGFAEDGFALLLDTAAARYVVQEPCAVCSGQGSTLCARCRGTGALSCRRCHGQAAIACPACKGAHQVTRNGRRMPCAACKASGRVRCPSCRGGKVACQACKGKARAACQPCHGTGWRSTVIAAQLRLKGSFVHDEALPEQLRGLLKELGGAVVADQHAEVRLGEAGPRPLQVADDMLAVHYAGRVPWGAIGLRLGAREMDGLLFGFRPLLHGLPPFLEESAAPGIAQLVAAAGRRGGDAALLHAAAEYRLVADALRAAARWPGGRAVRWLNRHYPVGVSPEGGRRLTDLARTALARLGRRGRLAGFCAGAALAGGLDALLPPMPLPHQLPAAIAALARPALLILGGAALTMAAMREGERFLLHRALPALDLRLSRRLTPGLHRAEMIAAALALAGGALGWLGAHVLHVLSGWPR